MVAIKDVTEDDHLMIINRSGITIRTRVSELREQGRATQGVRLIELREKDRIAAVAKVDSELHEDEEGEEASGAPAEGGPTDAPDADGTDVASDENQA